MEEKEQLIMKDGELATMMKHQEEDETQKLMEKEQQAMTSTQIRRALLIVQHVLSLHHLIKSYITHNLCVDLKVTTLEIDSMFFFADCLIHLQAVFRVAGKMPLRTQGIITQTCHCQG